MASSPIYQFYAVLDEFKPKVWRRFQIISNCTFARLGYIIQVLFEMGASHLMAIEVPYGENFYTQLQSRLPDETFDLSGIGIKKETIWRYEIPNEEVEPFSDPSGNVQVLDATASRLYNAIKEPGAKLNFNYDFGDDWWVSLTLEKVFMDNDLPGRELPRALEGAGFGIVEDVGGVPGLEDLVKAFKKKKGPEYEDYCEWLGIDDFDIKAFDLDDMNFRLKKIPAIYKACYEDMKAPSQKAVDLIERKYKQSKR